MLMVTAPVSAKEIIHEAEHHTMKGIMGEKWAANDKTLAKKLAELEKNSVRNPILSACWLMM